jgi:hypothetical protein
MSILSPESSGLNGSSQTLNLQDAPIIRERVANVDKPMYTLEQAAKFQATQQLLESVTAPAAPSTGIGPTPPSAYTPAPTPVPGVATPSTVPAAPAPLPPGTTVQTSDRVSERIARLFGERESERSRADALAAQLADTTRKLDSLLAREQTRTTPPTQNIYEVGAPQGTSRPADNISRAELQTLLDEQAARLATQFSVAQRQQASNLEAERDFPEVYSDPATRQVADRIWSSRPELQRDPNGPYLAAALARGLVLDPRSTPASAGLDPRKSNLAGVGVSVADGTGSANNRAQLYEAALAHARHTQRPSDFVKADLIRQGLA